MDSILLKHFSTVTSRYENDKPSYFSRKENQYIKEHRMQQCHKYRFLSFTKPLTTTSSQRSRKNWSWPPNCIQGPRHSNVWVLASKALHSDSTTKTEAFKGHAFSEIPDLVGGGTCLLRILSFLYKCSMDYQCMILPVWGVSEKEHSFLGLY